MLSFERYLDGGSDRVETPVHTLVVAGWTGRGEAALRHHIEALAASGAPRPPSVPPFHCISVPPADPIGVLGPDTCGEAEPILLSLPDGLWLGLGSDHTDRRAETTGIALSKQLCPKVVARTLWRLDEVADRWDHLLLRPFATIAGERVLYQEGPLAAIRSPSDLLPRWQDGELDAGVLMFCGTLGAIGGIRPASRFEMELEDPVHGRSMRHGYEVRALPVVT